MEDFKLSDEEFEDNELNDLIKLLKKSYDKSIESFCLLCKAVYEINEKFKNMPVYKTKRTGANYNKLEFFALFGFDHSLVSKYCNCYLKFVEMCAGAPKLQPVFLGYTPSKLFELLSVSNDQLMRDMESGALKSSMTKMQIREYVKALKGGATSKVLEENDDYESEDDIPLAFNPETRYDLEYFENLCRAELINCCLTYQRRYVLGKCNLD